MDQHATALERAFELARSGRCNSVSEIKMKLKSEGYSDGQVTGPSLGRQLVALIKEAKLSNAWRPKGEKRPGGVMGAAIKVAKIAAGEETGEPDKTDENPPPNRFDRLGDP